MGRPSRLQFPGAIFHAMARGNARQTIFYQEQDWERFMGILADVKRGRPFKLYAYCLMPNHVHLLLEPVGASISCIMRLVLSRYAKYLNARLKRTGHVFQDRFKAPLCPRDSYFQHLIRYIHLNPVKAGIAGTASGWPYSSHHEYLGQGRNLVEEEYFLSMLHSDRDVALQAYRRFLAEGPDQQAREGEPLALSSSAGSDQVERASIEIQPSRPNLPRLVGLVAQSFGFRPEILRSSTRVRSVCRARRQLIAKAFEAGYTIVEIAMYLRLSPGAISRALQSSLRKVRFNG